MYNIKLCKLDLDNNDKRYILNNCKYIAIDTETTGLDPLKDKLCLIQICAKEKIFLIKYNNSNQKNLIGILQCSKIIKIFHHANFDLRFLMKNLKIYNINNVVCTKIAAKLLNGIEIENSLKKLLRKYLNINIDKKLQKSNWSAENLTKEQIQYATYDVIYLEKLWRALKAELIKANLYSLAEECFKYLPTNAILHNRGDRKSVV